MSDITMQEIRDIYARAERIYTEEEIDAAYDRLAHAITQSLET